jgi:hypothetical protein
MCQTSVYPTTHKKRLMDLKANVESNTVTVGVCNILLYQKVGHPVKESTKKHQNQ